MRKYSFLFEAENIANQQDATAQQQIDPMTGMPIDPNAQEQSNFQPLIKSISDIPLSKDGVERLKVAAQIRQIEAKTKEIEAKALQLQQPQQQIDPNTGMPMDPNMQQQIDPMTGMPIDPNMQQQIDPNTGMPIDPNMQQQTDPLKGLGDRSAPVDSMGGMGMMGGGAIDPMTGMPMGGEMDDGSIAFTAIGRAQKLKDIYTSLLMIQKTLKKQSDDRLQKLCKQTNEVINLLKLVINNLKSYKDQIDSLIIMYYEFLKQTTGTIESIMQEKKLNNEYE